MPKKTMQRSLDRENFSLTGLAWFVAEDYDIDSGGNVVIKEVGDPRAYAPLKDPDLFFSFARLSARGKPSDSSILRWVRKHGLLRMSIDEDGKPKRTSAKWGELDQAPMHVEELVAESLQAHSALNLHADLDKGNIESLRQRISKLREARKSGESLSQMDETLVEDFGHVADGHFSNGNLPWMAEVKLAAFVMRKVERVKLGLWGNGFWNSPDGSYKPVQSFRCPDLYSAMYLQFYLLIAEGLPMRRCENPSCRMPISLTRSNRRFCNPSCRSNMRHYR